SKNKHEASPPHHVFVDPISWPKSTHHREVLAAFMRTRCCGHNVLLLARPSPFMEHRPDLLLADGGAIVERGMHQDLCDKRGAERPLEWGRSQISIDACKLAPCAEWASRWDWTAE